MPSPHLYQVHLASLMLKVDETALGDYDDDGEDETGFDSDTSNLSAKLLDEIFKKPIKALSAADKRELREVMCVW